MAMAAPGMLSPEMMQLFLQFMNQGGAGSPMAGIGGLMGGGKAGGAATGALGGAATGAALGSVVPGIGTAVGAIGGGIMGGLGGGLGGSSEDIPGPQSVFKKLMKRQYPVVSQSADRLAGISMREASRGANAAGMGNSAVIQSIKDSAWRNANEEKAGARDQFLQQAFDIVGAKQKAAAFQTMMNAANQGGQGGGGIFDTLKGWQGKPEAGTRQDVDAVMGLGTNAPRDPAAISTYNRLAAGGGLGAPNTPQPTSAAGGFIPGETEEQRRRRLLLSGTS